MMAWFQRRRGIPDRLRLTGGGQPAGAASGPSASGARRFLRPLAVLAGLAVVLALGWAWVGPRRGGPEPARLPSQAVIGFVWPEYPGELRVTDAEALSRLAEALSGAPARAVAQHEGPAPDPRRLYWRLELQGEGEPVELLATRELQVYDPAQGALLSGPELEAILSELTGRLHRSFFGEPVRWDQALQLLPVGGTASVRDVETGLVFHVRRHRGDAHADVEPLKAEDTETLRTVYGGEWSWKRRAVVATVDGRPIAGSMNGMPHGWGDLFENQFTGHFCLHFTGSRVHTTWRVDDGHQLMVLKAAGRLAETLDEAEPEELARWVMAAVNHHERATLRYLADSLDPSLQDELFTQLRTLFVWGTQALEKGEQAARVRVETTLYYQAPDPNTPYPRRPVLEFQRPHGEGPWSLTFSSLAQLLQSWPLSGEAEAASILPGAGDLPTLAELLEGWC